jgi:hypothetical protein
VWVRRRVKARGVAAGHRHTFCAPCLEKHKASLASRGGLKHIYLCPYCRAKIDTEVRVVGIGRIVALYYRSSTLYQVC